MKERPIQWALADRQLEDGEWDDGISIRNVTGDGNENIYIVRELSSWYKLHLPDMTLDSLKVRDANGNPVRLWCNSNVVYDPEGFLWGGSCAEDRGGLLHRLDLSSNIATTFTIPNKVIQHIVRAETGELILASGADDADGLLLFFDPETEQLSEYINAKWH